MNSNTPHNKLKEDSIKLFLGGIKAVDPYYLIEENVKLDNNRLVISDIYGDRKKIDLDIFKKVFVIGAGKASSAMASKIEEVLDNKITMGVVVTKYGFGDNLRIIENLEAGHPLPDENGQAAANKILNICETAGENDLIISLFSGGSSSLLPFPVEGISLMDKIKTTKILLSSGATINEINAVRKHISKIKGGRLMQAAFPATVISLVISDVIGDDLGTIGSGPFFYDDSTFNDCLEITKKYNLINSIPAAVLQYLSEGKNSSKVETPSSNNEIFSKSQHFLIGNNSICLKQIRDNAEKLGYDSKILNSQLQGIAKEVGQNLIINAIEFQKHGTEEGKKYCLLYGGETTVNVMGSGKGGRNQELALAAALELSHKYGISILSCGTDGNDGPTDAAGAYSDWQTIDKGNEASLNAEKYLLENDSYTYFSKLNDLIITGPTKTNVMDVQLVLIDRNIN